MAHSTCTRTDAILRVLTRSDSDSCPEGSVSLGGIFSVTTLLSKSTQILKPLQSHHLPSNPKDHSEQ